MYGLGGHFTQELYEGMKLIWAVWSRADVNSACLGARQGSAPYAIGYSAEMGKTVLSGLFASV